MGTLTTTENVLLFLSIVALFLTIVSVLEHRRTNSIVTLDHNDVLDIVDVVTQCSCPDMCPRCGDPVTTISCPDEHWHRVECSKCHLSMMTHDRKSNDGTT
jgi:hypothetical protein